MPKLNHNKKPRKPDWAISIGAAFFFIAAFATYLSPDFRAQNIFTLKFLFGTLDLSATFPFVLLSAGFILFLIELRILNFRWKNKTERSVSVGSETTYFDEPPQPDNAFKIETYIDPTTGQKIHVSTNHDTGEQRKFIEE